MPQQSLTGELNRFANGPLGNVAVPSGNDRTPILARGDLVEDIRDEYPGAAKSGFAVANLGVNDDVTPDGSNLACGSHVGSITNSDGR